MPHPIQDVRKEQKKNLILRLIYAFKYRFQDMTIDQFREIRAKAGGLIILLPDNLSHLSAEQRQVGSGGRNWIRNRWRIQLDGQCFANAISENRVSTNVA